MNLRTIEYKARFEIEGHQEPLVGSRAISLIPGTLRVTRGRRFDPRGRFRTHWFIEGPRVLKDGTVSHRSTHYRFGDFERASDLDGLRREGHEELANLIRAAIALLPDAEGIE
ncbi:hypothetical protein SEA_GROOTJR_73 [Gordonia phage GrootJr]|nr:hypothetical protein SEA_NOVUMREGINA_71 [Gordonia phage NovumRegina]QOR55913.1 hypothetical protein SEA_GROOTJR_73 [Gordonia phage GrootJr]